MGKTAKKSDPKLWDKVKRQVTAGDKGGRPGQWSARKAQMAVQEYKKEGGGYLGPKSENNSLSQWTKEDWGTKSGRKSVDTGERYLPRQARDALSPAEYRETTAQKRRDTEKGRQFSRQPEEVARTTAAFRHHASHGGTGTASSKQSLMQRARELGIRGRSTMTKERLARAIGTAEGGDACQA